MSEEPPATGPEPGTQAPRVSVCIPSYNAARFLPAAIESVLAQEFADFELVVSDDASSDDTVAVCAHYTDPRFRFVRSADRLGQAGNWNRCVELARSEYVILLHADDELSRRYLERAVAVLDAHDEVGLVHCAAQHIDEIGNPLLLQTLLDEDLVDRCDVVLRRLLLDGCVINPAGVMVRRRAYERAGPFTDRIVWGVDWHMWIRVALQGPVAYLAEPLARYREHGHSGTSAVMASGRNARDEKWAIEDLFDRVRETRPDLYELKVPALRGVAHRTWCFAETMCELGDMGAARVGLRNALGIWPGMIAQPRVVGLWAATYTGYRWFAAVHALKRWLARTLTGRRPGQS
jgi:glycosyltransferase involved in cell wall biosynthesis